MESYLSVYRDMGNFLLEILYFETDLIISLFRQENLFLLF